MMFWEKSYSPSQNISKLLEKEDVTVEELLDDEDILQECKLQTRHLVQFLTRPDVIKRLITLTITEPPENLSVAERFKYSNTACEILTFGLPFLDQKLVEDTEILETLYSFLENEPPLNPLLASFFSKTFCMLISKKSDQDWFLYQKMCLQLLEFIKSRGNFLDLIFRHFATPVIMDLLLQIIKEVKGGTLKKNLYEWLTEQKLVEKLINILGDPNEKDKHTSVAEFVVDLIKHGRSLRQSDHQEDSLELAFSGTDPLLQVLEDERTISLLLDAMLHETPQESSLIAGISIVLTLVDESIVDEPASDKALKQMIDKERENHERVVANVNHIIAPRITEFHKLLTDASFTNDTTVRPARFGRTRLEICRLITVLIQTGNEEIINAICETDYFNTLLNLFKQYSWNNFLHSEVEKCLGYVFASCDQNDNDKNIEANISALQKHVIVNCKIVCKLVECWLHNTAQQSAENGRRLGYMGHLIQILKNLCFCVAKFDHFGALIESTLSDEELINWKSLTDPENGELARELSKQNRLLADCDPKACHGENENLIADHDGSMEMNLSDGIDVGGGAIIESFSKLCENLDNDVISCFLSSSDEMVATFHRHLKVWGSNLNQNMDDDMEIDNFGIEEPKSENNTLSMTMNPWGPDPFSESATGNDVGGWADFSSNNFADFDSHFSLYSNDFGDKYDPNQASNQTQDMTKDLKHFDEKSDDEVKMEKATVENTTQIQTKTQSSRSIDLPSTDLPSTDLSSTCLPSTDLLSTDLPSTDQQVLESAQMLHEQDELLDESNSDKKEILFKANEEQVDMKLVKEIIVENEVGENTEINMTDQLNDSNGLESVAPVNEQSVNTTICVGEPQDKVVENESTPGAKQQTVGELEASKLAITSPPTPPSPSAKEGESKSTLASENISSILENGPI